MKVFKYRFEKILMSKEKTEKEIKKVFDNLKKEIETEKKKLSIALEKEFLLRQSMAKLANSGLHTYKDISDIKTYNMNLMYLSEYISRTKDRIQELETKMNEVKNLLIEAKKETKIYKKLREKEEKKHDLLMKQEEQKIIDDNAIFKFKTNIIEFN